MKAKPEYIVLIPGASLTKLRFTKHENSDEYICSNQNQNFVKNITFLERYHILYLNKLRFYVLAIKMDLNFDFSEDNLLLYFSYHTKC